MEAYQQRVLIEKSELDDKILKLIKFVLSQAFCEVDLDEQERLEMQLDAMVDYSSALRDRISAFAKKV